MLSKTIFAILLISQVSIAVNMLPSGIGIGANAIPAAPTDDKVPIITINI